jgi:hypothetical protein
LSLIALAEAIDLCVDVGQAFVAESERAATISNLSTVHAEELSALCVPLGWEANLFDAAGEAVEVEALEDAYGPFRLVIHKPDMPAETLPLLSNHALAQWLERGHPAKLWRIARWGDVLVAGSRVLQSWTGPDVSPILAQTKSPRALVKEFGTVRRVPEDVQAWLTADIGETIFAEAAMQVWVRAATAALMRCLPDEIDADTGALQFRGPPRLILPALQAADGLLTPSGFNALLAAVRWIFEHEREAQMRHILLAVELARSGSAAISSTAFLQAHLAHAHESALIAYQMALSETGRDTLKVLGDLRKAVTEETAKLSELSRQLAGAVAVSVATGIGLIAARVVANAPATLVAVIMTVVALYIVVVITSSLQFMRLQRSLRQHWYHRLYRFLPESEYTVMVTQPAAQAERSFVVTAWLGGVSVFILVLACSWVIMSPMFTNSNTPVSTQSLPPASGPVFSLPSAPTAEPDPRPKPKPTLPKKADKGPVKSAPSGAAAPEPGTTS